MYTHGTLTMKLPLLFPAVTVLLSGLASAQTPYAIDAPGDSGPQPTSLLVLTGFPDNIRKSASDIAWDLLQYCHGNESGQIPGILPGPPTENKGDYYWWQGGAMWGTLIDYWFLTGDASHNDLIKQGIL